MAGEVKRFVALQDFEWNMDNGQVHHYCKGLSYTARAGAAWDELRAQIPGWVEAGKISLDPQSENVEVEGKG
jgi:hypothetical protein